MISEQCEQPPKSTPREELQQLIKSIKRRITRVNNLIKSFGAHYSLDINSSHAELLALLDPNYRVIGDRYADMYSSLDKFTGDSPITYGGVDGFSSNGAVVIMICLKSRLATLSDLLSSYESRLRDLPQ